MSVATVSVVADGESSTAQRASRGQEQPEPKGAPSTSSAPPSSFATADAEASLPTMLAESRAAAATTPSRLHASGWSRFDAVNGALSVVLVLVILILACVYF